MGRHGPPPRPTELKLLRGERDPKRLNRDAPKPRPGTPRMPTDMSTEARAVWRHVLREMEHTGIIRPVHVDVLRVYCEAVSRYRAAARLLEATGPLLKGQKGEMVKNPLNQIVRDNARLLRDMAREMGLTPSSAEAIHLTGDQRPDQDAVNAYTAEFG